MKEKKRPVYDQDRFKNKQTNKTNPKQKQNKKAWTPESCNKGMWCHYYAVWGIFLAGFESGCEAGSLRKWF